MRDRSVQSVMRVTTSSVSLHQDGRPLFRRPFAGASVASFFGSDTPSSLDPEHRTPTESVLDELDRLLTEHSPALGLVLVPDSWGPHRRDLVANHLGSDVAIRNETPALLELPGVSVDSRPMTPRSSSSVSDQKPPAPRFTNTATRVGEPANVRRPIGAATTSTISWSRSCRRGCSSAHPLTHCAANARLPASVSPARFMSTSVASGSIEPISTNSPAKV